jgi:phosphatidylglycerol:prolipoprotein diacylglycerol transferase
MVHPVLFKLGPVTIYTYGLMISLGFLAAIFVARRLAPKIGVDPERFTDLAIFAILGGLVGSYVNFIISYDWSRFAENPASIFRFWEGGLVFLGGLIGGILFAVLFIHKFKLPLWEVADIAAICVPLAYGFGRIGCFFAGCCYGKPSDLPWAVCFPGYSLSRHPTQLYSMFLGFALAAFALFFRKRRTFAGQSFLLYLILYGLGRSVIEIFRADNPLVFGTPLTVAQFTGLGMAIVAAVLYPILRKHNAFPKE